MYAKPVAFSLPICLTCWIGNFFQVINSEVSTFNFDYFIGVKDGYITAISRGVGRCRGSIKWYLSCCVDMCCCIAYSSTFTLISFFSGLNSETYSLLLGPNQPSHLLPLLHYTSFKRIGSHLAQIKCQNCYRGQLLFPTNVIIQ